MGVEERVMDPAAETRPPPPLQADTPSPAHGGYDSYTGGGGRSLGGRTRSASQLQCRADAMPAYNEWHRKVFPELQLAAFAGACAPARGRGGAAQPWHVVVSERERLRAAPLRAVSG